MNRTSISGMYLWIWINAVVSGITEEPERVMKETLEPNFIFTGMNMFMPDTVKVKPGSVLTWFNNSNLPHNIVGIYKRNASALSIPCRRRPIGRFGLSVHGTARQQLWTPTHNAERRLVYAATCDRHALAIGSGDSRLRSALVPMCRDPEAHSGGQQSRSFALGRRAG